MATPRDVLDLPAPEGPSTATTSLDPLSVSLSWSLSRLAEVFTRAMLPGREPVLGTHGPAGRAPGSFGINNGRGRNANGGPATRPPPARPAASRPRRDGRTVPPRRPAARASARS